MRRTVGLPLLILVALAAVALGLAGCGGSKARVHLVTPQSVYQRLPDLGDDLILLDVRTPEEWAAGHIEGATLIPLDDLGTRAASELPKDAAIIVYCRSGNRSAEAASYLVNAGYTNVSDMGGILGWIEAGLPVVAGP
jgi:rhodanese-related sulfurtransferase